MLLGIYHLVLRETSLKPQALHNQAIRFKQQNGKLAKKVGGCLFDV